MSILHAGLRFPIAVSSFAIIASACWMAARNSSLFQVSTEWPSSADSSEASSARETNSRSASIASENSFSSASFREDCVTLPSPHHRTFGAWQSIGAIDRRCHCGWSKPERSADRRSIALFCFNGAKIRYPAECLVRDGGVLGLRLADPHFVIPLHHRGRSDDDHSSVTARPSDPAAVSDSPIVVARSDPGAHP